MYAYIRERQQIDFNPKKEKAQANLRYYLVILFKLYFGVFL